MSDELEQKRKFAKLFLERGMSPNQAFPIALGIFGEGETAKAMHAAMNWQFDAEVLQFIEELKEAGDDLDLLPSKADLARDIWAKLQGVNTMLDPEGYAKLAKLYAEVRGFIEKPQTNQNVQVVVAPKVIEVPAYSSAEDWESASAKQQTELLNVARSRH